MRLVSLGFCNTVVLLFTTFLCIADATMIDEHEIQPLVSWTGPQSQVLERRIVRIDNDQDWKEVWLQHLGKTENQAFNDSDTQFQVDFARNEVIAIFQGAGWNSRGLRLEGVKETANEVTIRYDSISYQTSGVGGGGVKVAAYAFIVFPKSRKQYRLQENTQGLKNSPSKWKNRAVLKTSDDSKNPSDDQ